MWKDETRLCVTFISMSRKISIENLPTGPTLTLPHVSKLSLAQLGGKSDFVFGNDPTRVVEFRHFHVEVESPAFRDVVLKVSHKTVGVVLVMLRQRERERWMNGYYTSVET